MEATSDPPGGPIQRLCGVGTEKRLCPQSAALRGLWSKASCGGRQLVRRRSARATLLRPPQQRAKGCGLLFTRPYRLWGETVPTRSTETLQEPRRDRGWSRSWRARPRADGAAAGGWDSGTPPATTLQGCCSLPCLPAFNRRSSTRAVSPCPVSAPGPHLGLPGRPSGLHSPLQLPMQAP